MAIPGISLAAPADQWPAVITPATAAVAGLCAGGGARPRGLATTGLPRPRPWTGILLHTHRLA